jgi:hypothetical protein
MTQDDGMTINEEIYFCQKCGEYCEIEYEDGYPYSNCCSAEVVAASLLIDNAMRKYKDEYPDPFRYYGENND